MDKLETGTADRLNSILREAGLVPLSEELAGRFVTYLGLLERWNGKLSLTAIREPEAILRRHFAECIFCAQRLPADIGSLLDYGSGGGFPGIPIALCHPEIQVTLAESQGKKVAFLRECVRTLGLVAEVYAGRAEKLHTIRDFDAVSLRAVDRMQEAIDGARRLVRPGGLLVLLTSKGGYKLPSGFAGLEEGIPGSENGVLVLARRDP